MPSCQNCHQNYEHDMKNYLLTCHQCARSWHHRCHQPQIPEHEMIRMWNSYLNSSPQLRLSWRCVKCSRKPTTRPVVRPPEPQIIDVDPQESTAPTRDTRESQPTVVSEIVDLTDYPDTRRSRRVQAPRAHVAETIDLSEPATTSPAPSRSAKATNESDPRLTLLLIFPSFPTQLSIFLPLMPT
ncbi:hypothetical protein C8R44DRAFT_289011 [Mycena epipterygia]|nr:hypothetical protein C8R44DRAFT_289011 [Mycena epipterygia]